MKTKIRCEVIIAVRDELPDNLLRTVSGVVRSLGPDDIVTVVMDGIQSAPYTDLTVNMDTRSRFFTAYEQHRGPGAARHAGIERSTADTIILLDGHMDCPHGFVDAIHAHLESNPKDVTCCHMQSLDHDWRVSTPIRDFGGCYFGLKTEEGGKGGTRYWAMSGKWIHKPADSGTVPCIMGACYGFKRAWYKRMGSPLSILRGWGQDEELLSLCSWLMGGRVFLLPITCGHVYAAPNNRNKADDNDDERHAAVNRYAVIIAMPMPSEQKAELHKWLLRNPMKRETVDELLAEREDVIDALASHIKRRQKRTWADLQKAGLFKEIGGVCHQILQQPAPVAVTQSAPLTMPTACPLCNPPHSFRVYSAEYWRCNKCGHKVSRPRRIV